MNNVGASAYVPSWMRNKTPSPAAAPTATTTSAAAGGDTAKVASKPYNPPYTTTTTTTTNTNVNAASSAARAAYVPPGNRTPSQFTATNTSTNIYSRGGGAPSANHHYDPSAAASAPFTASGRPKSALSTPPAMPAVPPSPGAGQPGAGAQKSPFSGGMRRPPTRMSPIISFRPSSTKMNPHAAEFVPSGLDMLLPVTTEEVRRPQAANSNNASSTATAAAAPTSTSGKRFNLDAKEYRPARTMARVKLDQPSPVIKPELSPEDRERMPLDELWSLFYLPTWNENVKIENFNPTLIFCIDSIATFWSVFNNISVPSRMRPCTLYVFRDGIVPKWEDKANITGGIARIEVANNVVDKAWELLLCQTVGDAWSTGSVRRSINGVALKIRDRNCVLEVWTTGNDYVADLKSDLAQLLVETLGGAFTILYWSHKEQQERAAAAEKRKQQLQTNKKQQYRRF